MLVNTEAEKGHPCKFFLMPLPQDHNLLFLFITHNGYQRSDQADGDGLDDKRVTTRVMTSGFQK